MDPVDRTVSEVIPLSVHTSRLEFFNGKTCARTFINNIKRRATIEKWSEEKTANIIRLQCTEGAQVFLDAHKEYDDVGLEELCHLLLTRFEEATTSHQAVAEFNSIKQGIGTVYDFVAKIEKLITKYEHLVEDLSNPQKKSSFLLHVFMSGIRDHIYEDIKLFSPETYEEAIKLACKRENQRTRTPRFTANLQPQRYSENEEMGVKCFECQGFGHLAKHCANKLMQPGGSYPDRSRFAYQPRCYNCHKLGHISRDCRQPRQQSYGDPNARNIPQPPLRSGQNYGPRQQQHYPKN